MLHFLISVPENMFFLVLEVHKHFPAHMMTVSIIAFIRVPSVASTAVNSFDASPSSLLNGTPIRGHTNEGLPLELLYCTGLLVG